MARHELIDGVAMNRQHPITFSVPSDGEKATIRPGDSVKVGFIVDSSIGQQERVWVQVQSVNHNKIVGVLDNDPVYADVRFGEQIEIELRHVLGIERLVSGSLRLGQNP